MNRTIKLTSDQKQYLKSQYLQKARLNDIAKAINVSRTTVKKHLILAGIFIPRRKGPSTTKKPGFELVIGGDVVFRTKKGHRLSDFRAISHIHAKNETKIAFSGGNYQIYKTGVMSKFPKHEQD